jgi:hypothetical protein
MFYLVYKITNLVNGKFYIGAHKTSNKDDGYMGSGKIIRKAIKKYGRENFTKEILLECSSAEEMFDKEREMVVVNPTVSYNIKPGGTGFDEEWQRIGSLLGAKKLKELNKDPVWKKWKNNLIKLSQTDIPKELKSQRAKIAIQTNKKRYGKLPFEGKTHTEETKKKIGEANAKKQKGAGNSMYGMMWITNSSTKQSKRIKKTDPIPDGWVKGRIVNKHSRS